MDIKEYYQEKSNSVEWKQYCLLMEERPEYFVQNPLLSIETDLKTICEYEMKYHKKIGVLYMSTYNIWIVDLVYNEHQQYFTYERCIPYIKTGAVVVIPVYNGKLVLLKQFRHAMREYQYAFPRGFGEPDITSEDNAKKEISEEIGSQVVNTIQLGEVISNSGLSADRAMVYLCEVTEPKFIRGNEEIDNLILVSVDELKNMINDKQINDGFTLSAFCLMLTSSCDIS